MTMAKTTISNEYNRHPGIVMINNKKLCLTIIKCDRIQKWLSFISSHFAALQFSILNTEIRTFGLILFQVIIMVKNLV